jgi:hypothetical protein
MLCRGFKHRFYCLHEFSSGGKEWIFIIAMGIITCVLVYMEWLKEITML